MPVEHVPPAKPAATREPSADRGLGDRAGHRDAILGHIAASELPLKYAYVGSAAITHAELADSVSYHDAAGSARHEASAACAIAPEALSQMVEIGPGTGRHTASFLSHVRQKGCRVERYLGLDFSSDLLEMARDTLVGDRDQAPGTARPAADVAWWDLEDGPTDVIERWRTDAGPVLACLLGQTLGNVESPADTLLNLSKSLRPDDFMLLGLAPRFDDSQPDRYLAPCRSVVFRRAALEPLRQAGIPEDALELQLEYTDNTVVGTALITMPVTCGEISLEAGHVVRCYLSRRFDAPTVTSLLENAGWSLVYASLDDDGNHLAAMATRT
jgi:L-histidine Nalpha-methyltransferase